MNFDLTLSNMGQGRFALELLSCDHLKFPWVRGLMPGQNEATKEVLRSAIYAIALKKSTLPIHSCLLFN